MVTVHSPRGKKQTNTTDYTQYTVQVQRNRPKAKCLMSQKLLFKEETAERERIHLHSRVGIAIAKFPKLQV